MLRQIQETEQQSQRYSGEPECEWQSGKTTEQGRQIFQRQVQQKPQEEEPD